MSRLRWLDGPPHPAGTDAIEIPHVRGHPVDDAIPNDLRRAREWPNRLGIREAVRDSDTVAWYPQLATRPDRGTIVALDLSGERARERRRALDDDEIDRRTRWLGSLVRRLEQARDVRAAAPVVAPCCIVLAPGGSEVTAATVPGWGAGLAACPARLGEFPGGIQLAITEAAWRQRDAYAATVTAIIEGEG